MIGAGISGMSMAQLMKPQGQNIRFAMLTGITKFGYLSVFSELNNLTDISFMASMPTYAGLTKAKYTCPLMGHSYP